MDLIFEFCPSTCVLCVQFYGNKIVFALYLMGGVFPYFGISPRFLYLYLLYLCTCLGISPEFLYRGESMKRVFTTFNLQLPKSEWTTLNAKPEG